MNPTTPPLPLEQPTQALLDLIEADRARQCAQILGDAESRAAALRAQARSEARVRMRQAFAEQRQRQHERIAAAQAQLATHRRLHEQQRTAALLRLAWEQLPAALRARWQAPATRTAWIANTVASARARMPRGPWRIAHAADWPDAERQALAQGLAAELGAVPVLEGDPSIAAGLKILANGNVIDGTLAGLLSDRAEFEARLLRLLESAS